MSSVAALPQASALPAVVADARPRSARRRRWRKWLAALFGAAVLSPGLLVLPPVWHGALRSALVRQAARGGYELTVERIRGGIFGATRLEGIRLREREPAGQLPGVGTDLTMERVRFAVAWRWPWLHRSASWLRDVRLEGVRGSWDLSMGSVEALQQGLRTAAWQPLPADFVIQAEDLQVRHGSYRLWLSGFLVSGRRDAAGEIAAREVRASGPGFASVFTGWHGQTSWQENRLTVTGIDLADGISLASATVDAAQLGRRRLDWDCRLRAFGGEVRGQGAVDIAHDGLALEIAATLQRASLRSLARTLGLREPIDGQVEQASCTFRGDPENLASAQMWLSARATGFQWGERRWESLDLQAVVTNRLLRLHRFDLRQDGNRLSLAGEFPLPPGDAADLVWTGGASWWRAAGFSCDVDARLEDLHGLSNLAGPWLPDLAGRMSINGQLRAAPGRPEIEGYLNLEGTRLSIGGAPLDYLRSTLLFRDGALEVADVQATHDGDYLTAHGVVGFDEKRSAQRGEVRVEIRDVGLYAPALAGLPGIGERAAALRHVDGVLRVKNGELSFEPGGGEQAGFLLAR